jgi:hypothetical protein
MYNLASDHAYTLLRAFKLTDGTELVKMRNPWSRENYDGPFSDSSDEWTDQRKEEAGWVDADDGEFFMTLDAFKQAFVEYDILMYQEDWHIHHHEV